MNSFKLILLPGAAFLLLSGMMACGDSSDQSTKTEKATMENAGNWEILFDGSNTGKWKGIKSDSFPVHNWNIVDSSLVLVATGGADIITKEEYSNFELEFDFNFAAMANSGLKYFVSTLKDSAGATVLNGPEYQIIDDNNNPAVKDHQHEEGATAALYLLYAPVNKKLLPAGQWNKGKIISQGNQVEHWLNGRKVVSYERGSEDFRKKLSQTKFRQYPGYGEAASGHILLTDHMDKVYFRNIRIRRL
jgi:hypothetical protein